MRCVKTDHLKPGDILGRTIYGKNGQILLAKGTVLKEELISRLKKHWIFSVYIVDPNCSLGGEDIINPETRQAAVLSLIEISQGAVGGSINRRKDYTKVINNVIDDIITELLNKKGALINMIDLKDHDNYTFAHSVNVAVLSIVTGISLGYSYGKLKSLGVGALLHDLGKVFIPHEVLNKPGKLSAEEFTLIKSHPEKGFIKSKEDEMLDAPGRAAILQHHEKIDGTGYPQGRKHKEIHDYAKIVAVADVYDAVTSDRPYRERWSPSQGLEYLYSVVETHLDFQIVKIFSKNIAPFPLGSMVQCSNGFVGYVIENEKNPQRPVLQIGQEKIDLSRELNIVIDKLLA